MDFVVGVCDGSRSIAFKALHAYTNLEVKVNKCHGYSYGERRFVESDFCMIYGERRLGVLKCIIQ